MREILIKLVRGGRVQIAGRALKAEHFPLRKLNRALGSIQEAEVRPSFDLSADTLARLPSAAAGETQLDLYFRVHVPQGTDVARLIEQFQEDEGVEYACDVSGPIIPAAATPNFTPLQGYLSPAPVGLATQFAHSLPGGDGAGVRVAVIEFGFNPNHEDLPAVEVFYDPSGQLEVEANHGTAVLGAMAALADRIGITGISFGASFLFGSITQGSLTVAIGRALAILGPGDFINISLQNGGGQPVEFAPDVFEGIQAAVAKGISVVEAAGNFGLNLAEARNALGRRIWDPQSPEYDDSGAILAGAGVPYGDFIPHSKEALSSYGTRVNAQAWGRSVVTSGYGLLFDGGPDALYTYAFGATSASASLLSGVGACLQGALIGNGRQALNPAQLREMLSNPAYGTPQASSPDFPAEAFHIGPQPDLKALFLAFGLADCPPEA